MDEFINNRYRIVRPLGKGGMGAVYLVQDTLHDDQLLALKTIRADVLGERSLAQFKYEFAALCQLRHPNLVAVYDFGVIADTGEHFFTMEYVPGQDLQQLVAQSGEPFSDYPRLYAIIVQVCRALQYIHSRGFIHYDVKPRNIRVTPTAPGEHVKLMDFGLIGEARGEGQLKVRGTPEYIAPELIRGDPVDQRADLYSLGVTLYEIVTGRLPFADTSSMVVLRQHVESAPELPRQLAQDIPEGLQALILKLMSKEPVNRYSSANEVIQAINELSGLNFPVETKETRRGYIQSGNFVGREFELARLQGLLIRMMQGHGRLVLIGGAAGVGKTRLVRELRLRAQMQRALACEGACRAQVRAPYQPWVYHILSQVISQCKSSNPAALQRYGASIARLMPELATLLEGYDGGAVAADRRGLMEAVAQFLLTCDAPLLLILEDLQYADAETIELLDYVGQRAAEGRVLICGVFRDDEVDESHPLSPLIRKARVISRRRESRSPTGEQLFDLLRVDVLAEADAADFICSMLGVRELPPGLLPRLMAETGGNPLFIESIMHNLVEEDLLRYDGERWQIDIAGLALPANIQEAAQRRLSRLDAQTLTVLQWVAVMGQWLDMDVLMAVCGFSPEVAVGLVNRAVQQHVLAASDQAGQYAYRFSNAQMQQAVYDTLMPEQRRQCHQRVGETLRRLYDESDVAEWLAWHFERAGDAPLALRYLRLAGDKARQSYANDSAIRHYTRALALVSERPGLVNLDTQFELLAGREECYGLLGDRRAQQADLREMERIAIQLGDIARRVGVVMRQVTLENLLGDNVEARRRAEAALDLARQVDDPKLEADSLSALGRVCFTLGDYARSLACFEEALHLCRKVSDRAGEATNLWRLGDIKRRSGQMAQAQQDFEEALAIYRVIGNHKGEADVLNALGNLALDYAQKRSYYEQSLAIAQSMGDRGNQARAYNNLSIIYWALGLYGKARDYMEQAVQIQRDMQGRSSLALYLETLGRVYLELGEYTLAQQVLEEGRVLSEEVGDRWAASLYDLMLGRVALARGQLHAARDLIQQACHVLQELNSLGYLATALAWLGAAHLALGDWQAARNATRQALDRLQEAGNAGDYPAQDIWWLHYQVLRTAPRDVADAEDLDAQAWSCLQRAREVMLSSIATLSDEGLRRNYLNKVEINSAIITEWTRQMARRGGEISLEAVAPVEEGAAALEADRARDKLKRVLNISLQMNETHDAELLLNYVMEQVIELSGAERGFLVLLDENGKMDFKVARGMAADEIERAKAQISYTVLGAVTQSRAPVLLQDALADERFGRQSSVLELNLRSVLCVPLLSRSELVGMIYADNRSVSGRFSQADVDLMAIFANQAATAIENARLYNETLTWARTLEQRVAERTAELQQANQALARRAMQLEISSQVGQQVTSILDLDELLCHVVNLIADRFGYYFVSVWLVNERQDMVMLRAGTGRAGEELPEENYSISLDTPSIIVSVCKSGAHRLVDDVSQAADYVAVKHLPDVRSELALPLRMGSIIIGVLDIQSNQLAAFGPDDVMTLQTLADQIAIAIRNAQLYVAEQTRRRLAESLERTGRELSSNLDLREVPARILEQLKVVVPYERGAVFLQEQEQLRVIAQRGFPESERAMELQIPIRPGDVFQQVVQSGRPVLIDDVTRLPAGWQQVEWLPVNRSWLGVPLIARDQVTGMISLTRREAGAFGADDATLVSAFAGQAAIALENASLYDEITRFNEQLEQMVLQRTEELNKAYRTLERLDKTKTDFINVAAHELRTPLTVIRGYAQVLESKLADRCDVETRMLISGILNGADRLHEIVNSMLDVTKIDSQTLRMRKERTKLLPIFERIRGDFSAALLERHLTLSFAHLDTLPMIHADPALLYKVFSNLVGNAIKYTPDGGSITVSGETIEPTADAPGYVEIVVSDTGIGIDPAHHELIFEKFYQTGEVAVHSSGRTKFKGGGPGLGLAIARGIVTAHGGKIWVESEGYDEARCPGSHFHVRLPVK